MKDIYSGQLRLRMPTSLHREIAERAEKEGVSLNTYMLYLLAKGVGEETATSQEQHRDGSLIYVGGRQLYNSKSPILVIDANIPRQ